MMDTGLRHNKELSLQKLYLALKELPKTELHAHFEGSISEEVIRNTLREVPELSLAIPNLESYLYNLTHYPKGWGFQEFLSKFTDIKQLFISPKIIEELIFQTVLYRAKVEQNLGIYELRVAPYYIMQKFEGNPLNLNEKEVFQAVINAAARAEEKLSISCPLVATIERQYSAEKAFELLEAITPYARSFAAIDLANDEYNHPPGKFAEVFLEAELRGFGRTVHAGETGDPENIRVAIEDLHAQRIGHGTMLKGRADLMKLVRERGVHVEACPTSNAHLVLNGNYADHGLKSFLANGLSCSLNTDDAALFLPNENFRDTEYFNVSILSEMIRAHQELQIPVSDLVEMQKNAVKASFARDFEKVKVLDRIRDWQKKWEDLTNLSA